jgi:hypothetical protein
MPSLLEIKCCCLSRISDYQRDKGNYKVDTWPFAIEDMVGSLLYLLAPSPAALKSFYLLMPFHLFLEPICWQDAGRSS